MSYYKVTFEGETLSSEDDKLVDFNVIQSDLVIPDDFMPKMFEYLESDLPYDVLYQIKSITLDGKEIDSKKFVSIIAEYTDDKKGGVLMIDKDGSLEIVGTWNSPDFKRLIKEIYENPKAFQLVVVTIAESIAP